MGVFVLFVILGFIRAFFWFFSDERIKWASRGIPGRPREPPSSMPGVVTTHEHDVGNGNRWVIRSMEWGAGERDVVKIDYDQFGNFDDFDTPLPPTRGVNITRPKGLPSPDDK